MASVIIIGLLSTLGVLIAILLLLAGGYLWWRHKRSQLKFIEPNDDEESTSGSLRLVCFWFVCVCVCFVGIGTYYQKLKTLPFRCSLKFSNIVSMPSNLKEIFMIYTYKYICIFIFPTFFARDQKKKHLFIITPPHPLFHHNIPSSVCFSFICLHTRTSTIAHTHRVCVTDTTLQRCVEHGVCVNVIIEIVV